MNRIDIVKDCSRAYEAGGRSLIERHLADDLVFSAPPVAKAEGRLPGKQPKLSPMQEMHLVQLYRTGAHTVSEREELFGITRSTVYRAVRRAGGRAPASEAA